jgi:hypothetical protein
MPSVFQTFPKRLECESFRHGRACPGHPRPFLLQLRQDVDGRNKSGHDVLVEKRSISLVEF